MPVTRDVLEAIHQRRSSANPGSDLFATINSFQLSQSEIAAGVTPVDFSYPLYTLLRYGADPTGAADSTVALQSAINAAQEADHAMVLVGVTGAILKIGSGWTIDTNKIGIDFQSAYLNASTFTTGNWLTPTQSASDVNQRPSLNAAHPIMNATWQGPGIQNSTAICLYLNDPNPTETIAGLTFKNIGFQDWGQDVYFGIGAFCTIFDLCTFNVTLAGSGGVATTYSITQAVAANSGERNIIRDGGFYNKELIAQNLQGGADLYFQNVSFDGFNTAFFVGGGAAIYVDNSHIESNTDVAYWGQVGASGGASGQNGVLSIRGGTIITDANKPNFSFFYSDSTVNNGGIYLDDVEFIFGGKTIGQPLCAGSGAFKVINPHFGNADTRPMLGLYANRLSYPGFESASYVADWTLTGSGGSPAPPVRSSAQAHSGTFSLSFPATSTNTPSAVRQIPCSAGAYTFGELWYLFPGTISGTLFGSIAFTDAGGNVIGSGSSFLAVTSVTSSWTEVKFNLQNQAPAGTVYAELTLDLFGATGTSVGYIDDVEFYVIP